MTTLWRVTTIDPSGALSIAGHLTSVEAVRLMLYRRKQGYRMAAPCAVPETAIGDEVSELAVHDPRCQSSHPGPCYGVLWQCEACGKTICCAEGTDDGTELCDDCWASRFDGAKVAI